MSNRKPERPGDRDHEKHAHAEDILPTTSVLRRLEKRTGKHPGIMLPDAPDDASPLVRPRSAERADDDGTPDRYHVIGEIAQGGMGVVFKGRDGDLGREVALKFLRKRHTDDDTLVQRFVEEAQIGGQLQHPGIVPIYDLGLLGARRPYFSMKLVKGKTLAALLHERESAAEDRLHFVQMFERITQTVAYAHARGVIHRDLKPANVMVGSFGEVQVMDWGLAKVLRHQDKSSKQSRDQETTIETVRSGSGSYQSQHGSVMGTLAYMSPEQAQGDVFHVDERADVFALGAILCEILTGAPPYLASSVDVVRIMAEGAQVGPALERLEVCKADTELVALCKKCLASNPSDRPASAEALANSVGQYLASLEQKEKNAELSQARSEARAGESKKRIEQERRAKKLATVLAATVVGAILIGGLVWQLSVNAGETRKTVAMAQISDRLQEGMRLRGEAQASNVPDLDLWGRALDAAREAERLTASGLVDEAAAVKVRETVQLLESDLAKAVGARERHAQNAAMESRLDDIEYRLGDHVNWKQQEELYASAFESYRLPLFDLEAAAAARHVAKSGMGARLIRAIDRWATCRNNIPTLRKSARHLNRVARLAETDRGARKIRAASAARDVKTLLALARSPDLAGTHRRL